MQMCLLGYIDQAKVDAEGPDDMGEGLRIKGFNQLGKLLALTQIFRFTQADMPLAQGLDRGKDPLAGVIQQDFTQNIAKQLDAGTQGLVFGGFDRG